MENEAVVRSLFVLLVAGSWAGLLSCRRPLRGTTLVAPWWWAVASSLAVTAAGGAALWPGWWPADWLPPLRFAAAVTTFCPGMAVLGAKRPQDAAWKFVVFSLWVVLAWPALEWMVRATARSGEPFEIHGVRGSFLLVLIGLGLWHTLPTRFWAASLAGCLAQLTLLADQLPLVRSLGVRPELGLVAAALGVWLLVRGLWRRPAGAPSFELAWREFRDLFGALWALRVAERVNAAALTNRWPVRLSWQGFEGDPVTVLSRDERRALRQVVENLLRRFVSPEWLAERLGAVGLEAEVSR